MLPQVPAEMGRYAHSCEEAVVTLMLRHPMLEEPDPCRTHPAATAVSRVQRRQVRTTRTRHELSCGGAAMSPWRRSSKPTKQTRCGSHLAEATKIQMQQRQVLTRTTLHLRPRLPMEMDRAWPESAMTATSRTAPGPVLKARSPIWPSRGATRRSQGWSHSELKGQDQGRPHLEEKLASQDLPLPELEGKSPHAQHQEPKLRNQRASCSAAAATNPCSQHRLLAKPRPAGQRHATAEEVQGATHLTPAIQTPDKLGLSTEGAIPMMLPQAPADMVQHVQSCGETAVTRMLTHPRLEEPRPCKRHPAGAAVSRVQRRRVLTTGSRHERSCAEAAMRQARHSSIPTKQARCGSHLAEATKIQMQQRQVLTRTTLHLRPRLPMEMDRAWPESAMTATSRTAPGPVLKARSPIWPSRGATRRSQGWSHSELKGQNQGRPHLEEVEQVPGRLSPMLAQELPFVLFRKLRGVAPIMRCCAKGGAGRCQQNLKLKEQVRFASDPKLTRWNRIKPCSAMTRETPAPERRAQTEPDPCGTRCGATVTRLWILLRGLTRRSPCTKLP